MTFYWLFEVLEKLVWATFLKCPQYGLGCKFLTNSWKTIQFQSFGETPEPKFFKYFGYFWTLQRSFYLSLLCAHGCPCKLLWTFFTMPLPQVFYEDPVRLALLCPTQWWFQKFLFERLTQFSQIVGGAMMVTVGVVTCEQLASRIAMCEWLRVSLKSVPRKYV